MRSIEIDFDVHKKIEMERRGFDESPNDVLRRLLGLGKDKGQGEGGAKGDPAGRAWSSKGVWLPHGTKLRMRYNGRSYTGAIADGLWIAEGKTFNSPSSAARGVASTKAGKPPQLDGWKYWEALLPNTGTWVPISDLRDALK